MKKTYKRNNGLNQKNISDQIFANFLTDITDTLTPQIKELNLPIAATFVYICFVANKKREAIMQQKDLTLEQIWKSVPSLFNDEPLPDIEQTFLSLLYLWKIGLFAPKADFPFSFEQTLDSINKTTEL